MSQYKKISIFPKLKDFYNGYKVYTGKEMYSFSRDNFEKEKTNFWEN